MENNPPSAISLVELLLKTGISAFKVLVPLLWLQSRLSSIQFLVAGSFLVLAAFLADSSPRSMDTDGGARRQPDPSEPRRGVVGCGTTNMDNYLT
jgi:hypothetical protein